jgi:hypothetical protein
MANHHSHRRRAHHGQNASARICGISIAAGKRYCRTCQITFAIEQVVPASPVGLGVIRHDDVATVNATAQAQRSQTKRLNDRAIKNWDPASQPAWLTEVAYAEKIQPLLAVFRPADIMNVIGASWLYASQIRRGMKLRMHGIG